MVKQIIRVVTITGADDSIQPDQLYSIVNRYPFVEFGILLQGLHQGRNRFPSQTWLQELYILWQQKKFSLSGHLCGKYVRDLCLGIPSFFEELRYIWEMFGRLQLNFHAEHYPPDDENLCKFIRFASKPFILQMDGVNDGLYHSLTTRSGIQVFPLFDTSGGAGLVPKIWPKQFKDTYCGYVGGLSPDNLQKEMEKISKASTGPIWIDVEKLVRSGDNTYFQLGKVRCFLKEAEPWVIPR